VTPDVFLDRLGDISAYHNLATDILAYENCQEYWSKKFGDRHLGKTVLAELSKGQMS